MGGRNNPDFPDPCLSSSCRFPPFDLQGISVGDCKSEHLVVTRESVRILDLETHSLQRSVWFDILSLSRFLGAGPALAWKLDEWVALYCACREIPSHYYDLQKIRDCLRRVQAMKPGGVYYEEALS